MAQWLNRLHNRTVDWRDSIQRDGWRHALPSAAWELLKLPYFHARFIIVGRDLSDPIPEPQPRISLEFRKIEAKDLELISKIHRPSEARAGARRLERGHTGLIAFHDEQPVGYAWGCSEANPELERVSLDLRSGDVLCTDAYTAPPFRRNGVQTALALARFQLFRDLRFHRALAYIEKGNLASLAVWHKVGAKDLGYIDYLRIAIWQQSRQYWLPQDSP